MCLCGHVHSKQMTEIVSAELQTPASDAAFTMQKLHQTAAAVHSGMPLTSALASYSGCDDAPPCVLSAEHRLPDKKKTPN